MEKLYYNLRRGIRKQYFKHLSPYRDIHVVSFPKSGRTWLRVMLDRMNVVLQYDHHGTEHESQKHLEQLPDVKPDYSHKRVLFLVRDPRDTAVSGYFHAKKREKVFNETLSEFIRDEHHGIKKILTFHSNWYDNQDIPKDFLPIRYEDMQKDTFGELRKVLDFAGASSIPDKKIRSVIDFGKFDNMQKLEKSGYFNKFYKGALNPKNTSDPDSFKTRKGKVGGFKEYLNKEDLDYCKSVMKDMGNPFYTDFDH
mgnify:CR=1 FL=1